MSALAARACGAAARGGCAGAAQGRAPARAASVAPPAAASPRQLRCRLPAASHSVRGRVRASQRHVAVAAAAAAATAPPASGLAGLLPWLSSKGMREALVKPDAERGCVAARQVNAGEVLMEVSESLAVTTVDVANHPDVASLAEGRGELVGLALWLIAERARGSGSEWAAFIATLPETTMNPMLWSPADRELLKGSPARMNAEERAAALRSEWEAVEPMLRADPARYPPATWTEAAFGNALAVVLARAVYLPAADVFALVPLADLVVRRAGGPLGEGVGALLDFDAGRGAVVVIADRPFAAGEQVIANDGQNRSNADLLLSTGEVDLDFEGDYIMWNAALLQADRLYPAKASVLQQQGLAAEGQSFPVYGDRFPNQLLAYLRLSRISEPNDMMKLRFDRDTVISQMNEYETLQLMMGDCRERLAGYEGTVEDEVKLLQREKELRPVEVTAARLRMAEKKILSDTMGAIRRRLAPIRGIPTKSGMQNQNSDLLEIFDTLENLNKKPREIINNMLGWDEEGTGKKGGGCG